MRHSCWLLILPMLIAAAVAPQGAVLPISLVRPVYPPIAVSARISGEVEVTVNVRSDGGVESTLIVSGPVLLQPAALDAAQKSRFECRGCSDPTTPYSVVFAFQFPEASPAVAGDTEPQPISVTRSQSRVTIVADAQVIIPHFSSVTARSAKCLWLWKCGSRRLRPAGE